jgi:4-hydroxy-3-polyprenylbenzoate decarboxylase
MYYRNLREYMAALEAKGKLVRIKREINKDTELMPLVRWQFRGLSEAERKAFLFENVVDVRGRKFSMPVAVGTHAASRELYALAMDCKEEDIQEKWATASLNPLPGVTVKDGPVQEVILKGDGLAQQGRGLDALPIPISTPGLDPAPFLTAPGWVTKDPETGVLNMGTYRAHLKAPNRLGIHCGASQHLGVHWYKAKALGKPLEAAIVLGGPPSLGLVSVAKLPYGTDEYSVAGAIGGEPVKLVKGKTVDLLVPAEAEIVIEGIMPTDWVEPEAPFGEYTGYMGIRNLSPYLEVTCITYRKDPIYHAYISQFPPSESSKIRRLGFEANLYKFLKYDCNIPGLMEVVLHEESGSQGICGIRIKKLSPTQPWQALNCAAGFSPNLGKIFIAVDDDIDPKDVDALLWALSFRMQPHQDMQIAQGKYLGLDPSAEPLTGSAGEFRMEGRRFTSALLIDATRKWDYPPVSLPKKEFMERARIIWEELGLPKLTPKSLWHGYNLGFWSQENEDEALAAVKGDYYQTGEKLAGRREKP